MSINSLIWRSLKKNLQSYYVYVCALVFSVALYFAFVTLQYDPALDAAKGSIKGAASLRAASILLVGIVLIFVVYANNLFMKRRSKEIGLYQLIGMTKDKVFGLLTKENMVLYFGSLGTGVLLGFSITRFVKLILFNLTQVEVPATLDFSFPAFLQTLGVFTVIFLLIILLNYRYIKKQSILSLFLILASTEGQGAKRLSKLEMLVGLLGITGITMGYLVSSQLFSGRFTAMHELFLAMVFILGSVIIGTYLFYKGSVSFILHLIRKKKNGYLHVNEVLSLSTIMFRMKSNALLLTIITTVSALAIGLLSLSYISYYSAEKTAQNHVAADFSLTTVEQAEKFKEALDSQSITYEETMIEVVQATVNVEQILTTKLEGLNVDPTKFQISVISEESVEGLEVGKGEVMFTGTSDLIQKFMALKDGGPIELQGIPLQYLGLRKEHVLSLYFTNGGLPVAIVDQALFEQLKHEQDPELQKKYRHHIGIVLHDQGQLENADRIFNQLRGEEDYSRLSMSQQQKGRMGLIMFIVGFLGLTFLLTSGCILYFKQMSESEEEKHSFTILRKLGFTQGDLVRGIQGKQLFNFGIPLSIGLLHGYFAVQSGWFLFGTELWIPMFVVKLLYAGLYSVFALLSVQHYRKVIREAL